MPRRYILFDGAPTLNECIASTTEDTTARWSTTTYSIPHNHSTLNEFQQASTGRGDRHAGVVLDTLHGGKRGVEPADRGEELKDFQAGTQKKRLRISTVADQTLHDDTYQSFSMLPPPSQPRNHRHSTHTLRNHFDDSRRDADETEHISFDLAANETTTNISTRDPHRSTSRFEDDSYAQTDDSEVSIGPPPQLPWKISSLTKLSQLRGKLIDHLPSSSSLSTKKGRRPALQQYKPDPIVSVLAAVSSSMTKDTSAGEVTEISLEDDSGGLVKVVAWGEWAEVLGEAIQIGDVVFFGKLKLQKSWQSDSIELRYLDKTSEAGIAYRTRIFNSQDEELYRWHREYATVTGEAEEVIKIVDWWTVNRDR